MDEMPESPRDDEAPRASDAPAPLRSSQSTKAGDGPVSPAASVTSPGGIRELGSSFRKQLPLRRSSLSFIAADGAPLVEFMEEGDDKVPVSVLQDPESASDPGGGNFFFGQPYLNGLALQPAKAATAGPSAEDFVVLAVPSDPARAAAAALRHAGQGGAQAPEARRRCRGER